MRYTIIVIFFSGQVLGTGERKVLTLSHHAQIRRFTADLQKVLKAQYGKQLALSAFSDCYGKPPLNAKNNQF
jgi:hypothetical protein